METKRKIYMSNQLVCVLPPIACKTLAYLCGWQSANEYKLYVHQMARAMKMTDEEVEVAIQTLIDSKLITVTKQGENYTAELNAAQFEKYLGVSFQKVIESDGIKLSENVTWNKQGNGNQTDLADMTEKDLQRLLLRIEAQLSERQQIREKVVNLQTNNNDDLPF